MMPSDVTYQRYRNQLFFVLFKRIAANNVSVIGYSLFVYDITKQKQGILLLKNNLSPDFNITDFYTKIELVEANLNTLTVYLFINAKDILEYTFKYLNEVEISQKDRSTLMQNCAKADFQLRYQIYP